MKRPVTGHCVTKGCPHISWQLYRIRKPPHGLARRRICLLSGKVPSYLTVCPLESEGI